MTQKSILNTTKRLFYVLTIPFILLSCGNTNDVVYFKNIDTIGKITSINNYNPVIQADDILSINISALDYDAVRAFNLPAVSFMEDDGQIGRARQQTYLVDSRGNIDFPVLGTLKLAGLNRIEATSLIKELLTEYIKDPIVNLRIMNFRITVLGEVKNPGTFTFTNERVTIIEALGMAGDMTIQAKRTNLLVLRAEGNRTTSYRVDMTSESVFNSPVYFLRQNDVVYVEQNQPKANASKVSAKTTENLRIVSTIVSVATLLTTIIIATNK